MRDTDPITEVLGPIRPGEVAVLGLPWDGSSTYLRGAAEGPPRIRRALQSAARNLSAESGIDLGREPRFRLLPDLDFTGTDDPLPLIEAAAGEILERGACPLGLGGDHSVTLGLVRACARQAKQLTLLLVDAHPDLYEEYAGERYSHASPMARIMEEGLAQRMIQNRLHGINVIYRKKVQPVKRAI